MASIQNGRSRFLLWRGNNYTLHESTADAGQSSVFEFDSGDIKSFRAGRPLGFNSLLELRAWRSYQVSAIGASITLPAQSVAGLGSPIVPPGEPDPVNPGPGGGVRSAWNTADPHRVYFLGNGVTDSQSYAGVVGLAAAAGYTHTWGRHTIPGAPLGWIYTTPDGGFQEPPYGYYPQALSDYDWDSVSFQPFDWTVQDEFGAIVNYLNLQEGRNSFPDIYLYQHWVEPPNIVSNETWRSHWDGTATVTTRRRNFHTQLFDAVKAEYPDRNVWMIPVGEVLYELAGVLEEGAIGALTSIRDVYANADTSGAANNVGRYINGLTVFTALYFADPRGLPVPAQYNTANAGDIEITATIRDELQEIVWAVCQYPETSSAGTLPPIEGNDIGINI